VSRCNTWTLLRKCPCTPLRRLGLEDLAVDPCAPQYVQATSPPSFASHKGSNVRKAPPSGRALRQAALPVPDFLDGAGCSCNVRAGRESPTQLIQGGIQAAHPARASLSPLTPAPPPSLSTKDAPPPGLGPQKKQHRGLCLAHLPVPHFLDVPECSCVVWV
jgi:hypothetical protein